MTVPDVAQPEVDLLNMLPRSNNNTANIPPKAASFDLLGSFETAESQGNNAMPDLLSESQTKPQGLDDLFGSIGQTNNVNSSNLPDLSSMGLNFNTTNATAPSNNNNVNFDPFGGAAFGASGEVLRPTSTETSPSQAKQPPAMSQTNKDPFADMANLASGLNLNWGAQSGPPAGTSPNTTQFSSPTHQFGGFVPTAQAAQSMQQARSPMENQQPSRPDYSRSHFETKSKQNGTNNTNAGSSGVSAGGVGGGVGGVGGGGGGVGDIFADILGQQGYNFATKQQGGPRSINEMRKEELVKDMDPDKLKIMEWVCCHIRI